MLPKLAAFHFYDHSLVLIYSLLFILDDFSVYYLSYRIFWKKKIKFDSFFSYFFFL